MAKQVSMSTVKLDVATVTTAPEFRVKDKNFVFGDLRVSQGGVFWRPKNHQQYFQLTWETLDEIARKQGTPKTVGAYNISAPPETKTDDVGETPAETLALDGQ